jgi:hypothetical protein
MAVTMKDVVFWDIKPQFVLHRRHIPSPDGWMDGWIFRTPFNLFRIILEWEGFPKFHKIFLFEKSMGFTDVPG